MDLGLRDGLKAFVSFQIESEIKRLYKDFLIIVEDIRDDRYSIDEQSYDHIRKRVLDQGNDSIRKLQEVFDKIDVILKNNE